MARVDVTNGGVVNARRVDTLVGPLSDRNCGKTGLALVVGVLSVLRVAVVVGSVVDVASIRDWCDRACTKYQTARGREATGIGRRAVAIVHTLACIGGNNTLSRETPLACAVTSIPKVAHDLVLTTRPSSRVQTAIAMLALCVSVDGKVRDTLIIDVTVARFLSLRSAETAGNVA